MKKNCHYDLFIESLDTNNRFKITWENKTEYYRDSFIGSGAAIWEYLYNENNNLWQHSRDRQLEIGHRLFDFLDGPNRNLERALQNAVNYGEMLLLNLCKQKGCEDWPFELLAKKNVFLLHQRLHLVRRLSDHGKDIVYTPKHRSLKLLFMCCAPLDFKPELDFHREEEDILRTTDRLAIDIDVEDSGTLAGLRKKLEQNEYDVIHLSGHAGIGKNNEPFFITENESGSLRLISPGELWDEALINNPPRLLFLSGCRTAQGSRELSTDSFAQLMVEKYKIPATLGWSHRVDDAGASNTQSILYRELSLGKSILDALRLTRYRLEELMINKPDDSKPCIWPQLRLFSNGTDLNALIMKYQGEQPVKELDMVLRSGQLFHLKEGLVGRRRQLQQGIKIIKDNLEYSGILIQGPAGLGKSSLAIKICQHCSDYHPIILKGKLNEFSLIEALTNAFRQNKDQKGTKIIDSRKKMPEKISELLASPFREKKYLLLLDDFHENLEGWDMGAPGHLFPEVADLLTIILDNWPLSRKMSSLIITSRFGFTLTRQGNDLVKKHLGIIRLTSFQEVELKKLAHKLAQSYNITLYPLFLQAANLGGGNPCLIKKLAGLVENKKVLNTEQLQIESEPIRKEFIRRHHIKELLTNVDEKLAVFLCRISIFRCPLPEQRVLEYMQISNIDEAKALLAKGIELGLLEHFQLQGACWLSPLLRVELLPEAGRSQPYHESAFHYYRSFINQENYIELDALEELIYHALGCGIQQNVSNWGAELIKHLRDDRFQIHEAHDKGTWLIMELEKKYKLSTIDDASLLNETAVTLKRLSEFTKAAEYFKKAYNIHLELNGEMDKTTAKTLNNLASVWMALGSHRKAAACYKKVLRIMKKPCDPDYREIVTILNNLGTAMSAGQKYEEAADNFEEALKIIEMKLDNESREFAATKNNLGESREQLGLYREAETCYRQAYDIACKLYQEPHPTIATYLNNLGSLRAAKGKYKEAFNYYRESKRIFTDYYGPHHLDVGVTLINLGDVQAYLGEKEEAEENYHRALELFNEMAPHHPQVRELEEKLKKLAN